MAETSEKLHPCHGIPRQFKTHQGPVVQSKQHKIKHTKEPKQTIVIILNQQFVPGLWAISRALYRSPSG